MNYRIAQYAALVWPMLFGIAGCGDKTETQYTPTATPAESAVLERTQLLDALIDELGPAGWGNCYAAWTGATAYIARGEITDPDIISGTESIGSILGDVRERMLSKGESDGTLTAYINTSTQQFMSERDPSVAFLRAHNDCGSRIVAAGQKPASLPTAPLPPQMISERETEPAACDRTARFSVSEVRAGLKAEAIAAALESQGSGVPALWTMSDEDTTIHILGTVHLLRPELDWLSPQIRAAMAASDRVVLEADATSPKAQQELMGFLERSGIFGAGEQLSSLLTPEEEAFVREALDNTSLPLEALQPMRPWLAALNISVSQITENGFDPEAGVESVIKELMQERNVTFAYLETVDQQLGGLAALEDCQQVSFLLATVQSLDMDAEMLNVVVDEWAEGDVHGLGLLMATPEIIGSQAIYDVMLTDRNRRWVPQIAEMLDDPGTVLVAVGAGHLAGADSVIKMLRDEGFSVEGP